MLVGCCVVWKFVGVFLVCAVCVFSLLFLSAFRLAGDLVDVCARGRLETRRLGTTTRLDSKFGWELGTSLDSFWGFGVCLGLKTGEKEKVKEGETNGV